MKALLDWKSSEVVNIFDEASLWAAPFGRLLLEHIPMKANATVVDIGFGTGFPLIELAQRFGPGSSITGVDIWEEAINRAKEKIRVIGLEHVNILEQSATAMDIADDSVDLVTSNLGVNNFDKKPKVYSEIHRILKPGARLCITTNTIGTFDSFFGLFRKVMEAMELPSLGEFDDYIDHRSTEKNIIDEFRVHGLKHLRTITDSTSFRFCDASAIFDHSLIRIGFREYWESFISEEKRELYFSTLEEKITAIIDQEGEFRLEVPMLYLEFEKSAMKG